MERSCSNSTVSLESCSNKETRGYQSEPVDAVVVKVEEPSPIETTSKKRKASKVSLDFFQISLFPSMEISICKVPEAAD
ncbi:hypothetical protein L1987_23487 [Smallanthus sonchifolius]|uniref:Uncharacterized protein n=1 Tax=Smallanthus sonchifolius TaxID=185202 RepID=A0ACB9IIC6_9ASTR|nr:hypothetical protein L1987_23487 [Smallanthus sonchifolius]